MSKPDPKIVKQDYSVVRVIKYLIVAVAVVAVAGFLGRGMYIQANTPYVPSAKNCTMKPLGKHLHFFKCPSGFDFDLAYNEFRIKNADLRIVGFSADGGRYLLLTEPR